MTFGGRKNVLPEQCRMVNLAGKRCFEFVYRCGYCEKHYRILGGK